MNIDLLIQARQRIGALTPLKRDCGLLCGAACCSESDAGDGMLLFPGEEALLPETEKQFLYSHTLSRFGPVLLYVCTGTCDRESRPLACRIFPLAPFRMRGGRFRAQIDVRGRPICPLTHSVKQSLDPDFVLAVEDAFNLLAEDEEYAQYLTSIDAVVREYASFSF